MIESRFSVILAQGVMGSCFLSVEVDDACHDLFVANLAGNNGTLAWAIESGAVAADRKILPGFYLIEGNIKVLDGCDIAYSGATLSKCESVKFD